MNIIVTGASRGIGYELVRLFAEGSGNTIFALSRNREKLEKLCLDCHALPSGKSIVPLAMDLEDEDEVGRVANRLLAHVNEIDLLINNAGVLVNKPFMEIRTADLQSVYNVNVFSVIRLIQQVLPLMNAKKRSHIVNISSMGGFQGSAKFAGLSAYSSSKAALACLTECLAEEFRERNTAFNCLALGAAQTEMLEEAFPGYKAPLSAKEMAAFIADFGENAQRYLNGRIIPVAMSTP